MKVKIKNIFKLIQDNYLEMDDDGDYSYNGHYISHTFVNSSNEYTKVNYLHYNIDGEAHLQVDACDTRTYPLEFFEIPKLTKMFLYNKIEILNYGD